MPLDMAKEQVADEADIIYTYCTHFFNFEYLDKGYEVVACRGGKVFVLSELLSNEFNYCDRQVRRQHNTEKMLRTGTFKFR